MEGRVQTINSRKNSKIKIGIIPGHFATNHSHINYYVVRKATLGFGRYLLTTKENGNTFEVHPQIYIEDGVDLKLDKIKPNDKVLSITATKTIFFILFFHYLAISCSFGII